MKTSSSIYIHAEFNLDEVITVVPIRHLIEQEPLIDELVYKEVLGSLQAYPLNLPLIVMPYEAFIKEYVGEAVEYVKANREEETDVVLRGCNRLRAVRELGYSLVDTIRVSTAFEASTMTEKIRAHSVAWEQRIAKLRNEMRK